MSIPFLNDVAAELGIVGFTISSLVSLVFYIMMSSNKREDKRAQSFQETICEIHKMHKNERCEWREDAALRQDKTNEALKELSKAIHELSINNESTVIKLN